MSETDWLSPGTASNDDSIGNLSWYFVNNIKISDDSYSLTSEATSEDLSNRLKATNFGFSIPDGATITGILVSIERNAKSDETSTVSDLAISIIKSDGSIGGIYKAYSGYWPKAAQDETVYYGGSSDLWGESWTPSDINNSNFGVALVVQFGEEASEDRAYVDHIQIKIYYNEKIDGTRIYAIGSSGGENKPFYCSDKTRMTRIWVYPTPSVEFVGGSEWISNSSISSNGEKFLSIYDGTDAEDVQYSGLYVYYSGSWSELVLSSQYYFYESVISGDGTKVLAVAENKSNSNYECLLYYNGSTLADVTPITPASGLEWGIDISEDGTKFIATATNGYVYTYNGSSWTSHQPVEAGAGEVWNKPHISADGTKFSAILTPTDYESPQKLYYYNGSGWSEVNPLGEETTFYHIWSSKHQDFGDAVMAKSGAKKFFFTNANSTTGKWSCYSYDGSSSVEQDPFSNSGSENLQYFFSIDSSYYGNKMVVGGEIASPESAPLFFRVSYYNGTEWTIISENEAIFYYIILNKYQDETVSPFPSFRVI